MILLPSFNFIIHPGMRVPNLGLSFLTLVIATASTPISFNISATPGELRVLAQTPQGRKEEADRLLVQGVEQFRTSQFKAAMQSWQQALSIYREIKDRQSEGLALGGLGNAYLSLGDYPKAIDYYQQRLAITRSIQSHQSEGDELGNLGFVYLSLGDYPKAIDYYQQSLAITRLIQDRQSERLALNNLGFAYYKQGNLTLAESTLIAGIKVLESLRNLDFKDGEKGSFFETQRSTYRLLQQVLIAQNKTDAALEISERGRGRAFVELPSSLLSANPKEQFPTNI